MAVRATPLDLKRKRHLSVFIVLATIIAVFAGAAPAVADPDTDDEGGNSTLREKLEQASVGYYAAKETLAASQKRQAELTNTLRDSELALTRIAVDVDRIAAARYKGSQLGFRNGLFPGVDDPGALLQGAAVANYLVWRDDETIRKYRTARDQSDQQKRQLEAELAIQTKAFAELDEQKRSAEKALAAVGGMASPGFTGQVPEAQPAPRNANGSFPKETASVVDPTGTGGKISPRMYHALTEAQFAGFQHYTRCYRPQNSGEHPKGRACDCAADKDGFGGVATGDSKAYGTRLAAWCVANADALGVLYVIWFRQIWMPGVGWRAYSGSGDPSAEHTNHVHLSVL